MEFHINTLPPITKPGDFVALDIEMIGLPEGRLHRPKPEGFGLLTITSSPDEVYVIMDRNIVQEALQRIDDAVWVFHNAMFDLVHLRSLCDVPDRKKIWDTHTIERIMFNGLYSAYGLDDLTARYLDKKLDKTLQKAWINLKGEITNDLIQYAIQDGVVTLQIAQEQKKIISANDFKLWKEVDCPAMWALLAMRGFPLDVEAWRKTAEENLAISASADVALGFNPRSVNQVKAKFKELGITLTSTDDEALHAAINKAKKSSKADVEQLVNLILESRQARKLSSTYGFDFLEHVEQQEGVSVIHGSYNLIGAETGRLCVAGDTLLSIDLGYHSLADVFIQDIGYYLKKYKDIEIKTHTGNWKRILNVFYKGKEKMYKVVADNGYSRHFIKCTKGHRFLVEYDNFGYYVVWKSLDDLSIGDEIMMDDLEKFKIVEIKNVGVEDVWDIEVEDDHSYVAHGFINHNSSKNPNMQNIPARGTSAFREMFIPYPGEVLIVSDYSSQEPRIAAGFANDPNMIEVFVNDKDIYIEMASRAFNETISKSDPRRKQMKSVILGMIYGLSKYGLSKRENMTVEDADELLKKVFSMFPASAKYMAEQRKKRNYVQTLLGRKTWLNPYSGQCERNALNAPVQGSASDQMKVALGMLYANWPRHLCKYGLVATVHDEVVCSVPESCAEEVAKFVSGTMVAAAESVCKNVPFKAEATICKTWAEKG